MHPNINLDDPEDEVDTSILVGPKPLDLDIKVRIQIDDEFDFQIATAFELNLHIRLASSCVYNAALSAELGSAEAVVLQQGERLRMDIWRSKNVSCARHPDGCMSCGAGGAVKQLRLRWPQLLCAVPQVRGMIRGLRERRTKTARRAKRSIRGKPCERQRCGCRGNGCSASGKVCNGGLQSCSYIMGKTASDQYAGLGVW